MDAPDGILLEEIIGMILELENISDNVSSALARRRYETEHIPAAIYLPSLPKTLVDMQAEFNELIENIDYLTEENDLESLELAYMLKQEVDDFFKKYHWIIDKRSMSRLDHKITLLMNNLLSQ